MTQTIRFYNCDGELMFTRHPKAPLSDRRIKGILQKIKTTFGLKYCAAITDTEKGFYTLQVGLFIND